MADEIFARWRWEGSDPEEGKLGALRIKPDGSMELNMLIDLPAPNGKPDLILGCGSEGEAFSLTGLFFDIDDDFSSVSKVYADQLLEGIELSTVDQPVFDRLWLSFRNLLEVRNTSNRTIGEEPHEPNSPYVIGIQDNVAPLHASTPRGKLNLHIGLGTSRSFTQEERLAYDQASYSVQLPSTTSLDGCLNSWFSPLRDLTSFMAQCGCAPLYVRASGPDLTDCGFQKWITVRRWWLDLEDDYTIHRSSAISNFSEEPGEFERLIKKWLDLHANLDRSLSTYFVNEWEIVPLTESRFLNAAIAAEGYHRRIHGDPEPKPNRVAAINDILKNAESAIRDWLEPRFAHIHDLTFRERISALTEHAEPHIGSDLVGKEFVRRVVDARNALVHHDKDSAEKAPSDTLRLLADTIQVVITICIADYLGLDLETCKERMSWKLNWLKSKQHLFKEDAHR